MATVDRVRVWRRSTPTNYPELVPLLEAYRSRRPKAPFDTIVAARVSRLLRNP